MRRTGTSLCRDDRLLRSKHGIYITYQCLAGFRLGSEFFVGDPLDLRGIRAAWRCYASFASSCHPFSSISCASYAMLSLHE